MTSVDATNCGCALGITWRFLALLGIFIPLLSFLAALCNSSQYWLVYEVVVQVIYDNTIETMLCYCRNLAD